MALSTGLPASAENQPPFFIRTTEGKIPLPMLAPTFYIESPFVPVSAGRLNIFGADITRRGTNADAIALLQVRGVTICFSGSREKRAGPLAGKPAASGTTDESLCVS